MLNTNGDNWIIDSGASVHMTTGRTGIHIQDYKRFRDGATVIMGNGTRLPAEGKGSITLQTSDGQLTLSNIWVVPGLDTNLISVGEISESDHTLIFDKTSCKILDSSSRTVFSAPKVKNLYRTNVTRLALANKPVQTLANKPAQALATTAQL
jgi:hypothetical protein